MNSEIVESVLHSVTPSECKDLYYPGEENSDSQCFPSVVDNRYYQDLASKSWGSTSVVTLNPDQGVQDIVLTLTLPAPTGSMYTNWTLARGWGALAIKQIGLRIGGSSLYYFTGDQILVDNLTDCEDTGKKNALLALAGSEITSLAGYNSIVNRTAYVYLKMPFNTVSALQKQLPLPTDLLTQPLQLLVELKNATEVFVPVSNGQTQASISDLPSGFDSASVNFKQVHLSDSSHLLARRENMNEKMLSFPLRYFTQTAFRTTVSASAGQEVQINLTGFRSGSVKHIDLWAVKTSDVATGQGWKFANVSNVRLSVNGLVYYDSRVGNSQMWALCDRKTPASVDTTVLADATNGTATATPSTMPWTVIPFSQVSEPGANHNELALGLNIMNSVVNLSVVLPEDGQYVISASYHYASNLLFTKGSCEYVFA